MTEIPSEMESSVYLIHGLFLFHDLFHDQYGWNSTVVQQGASEDMPKEVAKQSRHPVLLSALFQEQ